MAPVSQLACAPPIVGITGRTATGTGVSPLASTDASRPSPAGDLGRAETLLRGPRGDLRTRAAAELGKDAANVALDRALAQYETFRHRAVRTPGGDEDGHFLLASGESAYSTREPVAGARVYAHAAMRPRHKLRRQLRIQQSCRDVIDDRQCRAARGIRLRCTHAGIQS